MLTYRKLLEQLKNLDDNQLDSTVTVLDEFEDEFFGATRSEVTQEVDVLDENHFFLVIKTPASK